MEKRDILIDNATRARWGTRRAASRSTSRLRKRRVTAEFFLLWHNSSICHWSILQVPSPFLTRSWKNSHLNWQRWSSHSQWFSNKKSNHVNFRLLGTWEILTCPGTRSRCCRKTSERSKCWKLSPWQRTIWTLSRRWNHMCQKALPITNLLDSMYHCIRQPELLQDMGKLTKLENLNLSFNLIQSIPMSLQQLKNLK